MFYRGLAILLCSCLIAGSLPQSAVAKEPVQTETAGAEFVSLNEEGEEEKKDDEKKDEEPKPEPEPEPKPEPEPEPKPEPEPEPKPEPEPEPKPTETKTEEKPEGGNTPTQTEAPPETPTETQESPEGPTQTQTQAPTETETQTQAPTQTETQTPTQTETEERPETPSQTQTETQTEGKSEPKSEEKSEPKSEESSKREESSKVEESRKEKESKTEKPSIVESSSIEESSSEEKSSESEEERLSKTIKNGQSTEVTLKSSSAKEQIFKFTAPSAGYYNFFVDGADVSNVRTTIYDSVKDKNQIKQRTYQDKVRYLLLYMEKGQSVYPAISLTGDAQTGKSVQFGVKKAAVASVQETEGGYTATASSIKANIGWRPASRTLTTDLTISAESGESYLWQIVYGNGDVGYTYAEETVSPNTKKEKSISGLTSSQEYSFTMYLLNSNTKALEAVLISDSNAIKLKTGASKENVVFRSTRSTYDSITIDIEAVDPVTKINYGPLAEYEKEVSIQKYISGLGQVSVSGLEPATTYYFEFYNASGIVTAYTTVDTKEYPAKVNYTVKATGPDSISMQADITAYEGEVPESFNLCYEILDEFGKPFASGMEKTDTKGREQWRIEAKADDLEAATRYTVRLWINEPGYTGHFKETARTVTTDKPPFAAEALKVNIVKNNTKSYTADYTVTIEDYLKTVSGKLKYRMKDSLGKYEVVELHVRRGKAKGVLTGLQEGAEYEYEIRLSGVVKRGTFKMGAAVIKPELSADTGAYDAIISYKVKSKELQKGTAYSVKLYYYNPETKLYAEAAGAGKMSLTPSENYTASVQAADLMALSPDTQYGFKWELYAGSTLAQTIYQLVTTEKSEVSVDITANTVDTVNYNIKINGRTENISNDITLFTYIREEDGEYRRYGDSFNLYKSKGYQTENRVLAGLTDERTYTISFRDIKGGEYGTFTFTFEAKIDGVMMGVTSLVAGAHNFVVQASIEGETDFENQYAVLFFKEKNQEDWDIRSSLLEKGQTACGFELTSYLSDDLNADTIYEFVMGVSDTAFPKTSAGLKGVYSSEVLTQADARSLTNVSANSGYSYISLKAALTNNPINTTSYIYVFYKEADEWEWIKSDESFIISDTTGGILTFIKGLKAGTEYDYIVAVSDSGFNTSLSEIEEDMRQSGSVTTKNADITLAVAADEERSTAGSELLTVKASGAEGMKKLKAVLTLDSENGEQYFVQEAELLEENGFEAEVSFDGLSPEMVYSVTSAQLQVMETIIGECYAGTVAYLEPQYSFTTKSVQLPETISLSQEQIALLYDTSVSLSAQVLPSGASSEVIWSSSDETVATVDKDGTVYAAAQGEAVITAASAYSAEIFAQCSVCVKSYAVVEKDADGSLGKRASSWKLYKGSGLDIALCEILADGTLTEVDAYEAVSDKPAVAQIENGVLTGTGVGKTGVTLKKDGIEVRIDVRVDAPPERFEILGLSAKDIRYPAIKTDDAYEIALKDGVRYEVNGTLIPSGNFDAQMLEWRSSDTGVLEINDRGVINPVSAGTATITAVSKSGTLEASQERSLSVHVKPAPEKKASQIVVGDTAKEMKLEDIALGDELGAGWEWKNPQTTVYMLSEEAEPYTFEVVYTNAAYYARESSVKVYYGNALTGAAKTEAAEETQGTDEAQTAEPAHVASGEAPEVSVDEITVNTAYNYRDSRGKELSASQYGSIEIDTAQGQYVTSVELTGSDEQVSNELELCDYGVYGYLVRPVSQELSQGTYKCKLKVMTNASTEPYFYPIKVNVVNKKPKLFAEVTKKINLFYTKDEGQLLLTPEIAGMEVDSFEWADMRERAENGFEIVETAQKTENGSICYKLVQNDISVVDGALADESVADGTLTVTLKGVREPYYQRLKIKTCYKEPKLSLTDYNTGAGSSMVSAANGYEASIKVYDATQKRMLRYGGGSQDSYDEVRCENDTAVINKDKGYYTLRVSYGGTGTLAFVFGAEGWRDTVRAEYTIKSKAPSAQADKSRIVFNTAYSDRAKVNISLKDCAGEVALFDVEVKGADEKSQQLMENNSIQLVHDGSSVLVSTAKTDITGSYTYKLTPYYVDCHSGEKKALNTLTLRVKLINGTVKPRTTAKPSADKQVCVKTDFSKLGDMHRVKGARLVGEYSRYFTLQRNGYDMSVTNPELLIKETNPEMLKKSGTYKMSVVYTIETGSGATYEVQSKEFKVRCR